jgi:glucoamylase
LKQKILRIEVMAATTLRWSSDNWKTHEDLETKDTDLGIYIADIDIKKATSREIKFTFFWKEAKRWEGKDFDVQIVN